MKTRTVAAFVLCTMFIGLQAAGERKPRTNLCTRLGLVAIAAAAVADADTTEKSQPESFSPKWDLCPILVKGVIATGGVAGAPVGTAAAAGTTAAGTGAGTISTTAHCNCDEKVELLPFCPQWNGCPLIVKGVIVTGGIAGSAVGKYAAVGTVVSTISEMAPCDLKE